MPSLPALGTKPWKDQLEAWLLVGHDAAGNNLGAGPDANKVDKDSVVNTATRIVVNKLLAGDTQPNFRILGSGRIDWGVGGVTAPVLGLYFDPASPTDLRVIGGGLTVNQGAAGHTHITGDGNSTIYFGNAYDTNLYRSAAGFLKSDGVMEAAQVNARPGGAGQVRVGASTTQAMIQFGSANDLSLYRAGSGYLDLDGGMLEITHPWGLGIKSDYGQGLGIRFGTAYDAGIYRAAAWVLAINNSLVLTNGYAPVGPQARNTLEAWISSASLIAIGETADGNANPAIQMYRTAAGGASGDSIRLTRQYGQGLYFQYGSNAAYGSETFTDIFDFDSAGNVHAAGSVGVRGGFAHYTPGISSWAFWTGVDGDSTPRFMFTNAGQHYWSPGNATWDLFMSRYSPGTLLVQNNLYATGYVQTDGEMYVGSNLKFGNPYWDVVLYRSGANILKTDDSFHIGSGGILALNNSPQQIEMAWSGSSRQYRHTISTQHVGGAVAGNWIDFNIWTSADSPDALGTTRALRVEGDGAVIVGGALFLGGQKDVYLYRFASTQIRCKNDFLVEGSLTVFTNINYLGKNIVSGNPDSGGTGYRMLRITN